MPRRAATIPFVLLALALALAGCQGAETQGNEAIAAEVERMAANRAASVEAIIDDTDDPDDARRLERLADRVERDGAAQADAVVEGRATLPTGASNAVADTGATPTPTPMPMPAPPR